MCAQNVVTLSTMDWSTRTSVFPKYVMAQLAGDARGTIASLKAPRPLREAMCISQEPILDLPVVHSRPMFTSLIMTSCLKSAAVSLVAGVQTMRGVPPRANEMRPQPPA